MAKQNDTLRESEMVSLSSALSSVGRPSTKNARKLGANIRRLRETAHLTQAQVAVVLGVSRNAIAAWERDAARPDIDRLIRLCFLLDVSADEILGIDPPSERLPDEDRLHLQLFHSLSERDQRIINTTMDVMHETDYQDFKAHFDEMFDYRPLSPLKACAGSGVELVDARPPMMALIRMNDVTSRCDEIVRITGDSMLPEYADGDRVLLEHRLEIDVGQVGIFTVDGEGMIKEFQGDRLHPLNPEYPDIRLSEGADVRCVGLVLGKLTQDLLPTRDEQYMIDEILREHSAETRKPVRKRRRYAEPENG